MNALKWSLLFGITLSLTVGCSQPKSTDDGDKKKEVASNDNHGDAPHWSYEGKTGPEHWGSLDPAWAAAKDGKEQSPIDIADATAIALEPIEFHYESTRVNIINNGHTIQVNCDPGSYIEVDGETYQLAQFHFHAPSEHTIDGEPAAIEMHLVHKSAAGELAVVGVMIQPGEANAAFDPAWKHLPKEAGAEQKHEDRMTLADLLPAEQTYYTYPGSLTTPPCSEGVKWLVTTTPIAMSAEQIAAYTDIYSGNNRPIQPLNERVIEKTE